MQKFRGLFSFFFFFLIFKSSRVSGEISVVFSGSKTHEQMMTQRNKGNHKDSFLIIVPKHICPGTVGANWPSLITTQARGAGLAGPAVPPGPGPAVLLWPHSLPRAFICPPAPPTAAGVSGKPCIWFLFASFPLCLCLLS